MDRLKNFSFIRKIQISFFIIAAISTIIVVDDLVQLNQTESAKNQIFDDYIKPKQTVDEIYTEFNILQFNLLKFSIPSFETDIEKNMSAVNSSKDNIDKMLKELGESKTDEATKKHIKEIQDIWANYKNVVADAILSAGVTKNYDMAAVVSVTSGQEVGNQLKEKFDAINKYLNVQSNVFSDDINGHIGMTKTFILIGMVLGTIMFLIAVFKIAPALTGPINKLKQIMLDFTEGDFEKEVDVYSHDEFGELAEACRKLQTAQKEKIDAAISIANGKMDKLDTHQNRDKLAEALNIVVDTLQFVIQDISVLTSGAIEGKLSVRGDETKYAGDYKKILHGINSTMNAVVTPLSEGRAVLEKLAGGDLTAHIESDFKGEYHEFKESINKLSDSLSKVIGEVSSVIQATTTASNEISSSAEEMAAGSAEQSQQANEVAAAIEQMTKTILDTTKNAASASNASKEAGLIAKEGGQVVTETIEGMNRIAAVVQHSADTVQQLGKSSDQIGEIIQVIDDIADQTNLLALNAAIEAARAGEQGRGFAVVADEVRKLAERTTKATKEIAQMIKQIQKDTEGAVSSMQEGKLEVEKGKELTDKAGVALNQIISGSTDVVDIVSQVAAASEEQSSTSEQISRSIESITTVTQESAMGIQQIARSAEDLNKLTGNLSVLIAKFKIERSYKDALEKHDFSDLKVRSNGKIIR